MQAQKAEIWEIFRKKTTLQRPEVQNLKKIHFLVFTGLSGVGVPAYGQVLAKGKVRST